MKQWVAILIFVLSSAFGLGGPVDKDVDKILNEYFKIQDILTQDSVKGVDAAARTIVSVAGQVQAGDAKVQALIDTMKASAERMQGKELKAARNEFFELSKPLLVYLNMHYSGDSEYFRFYCDMAKKGWIQSKNDIRNPYYGSEMLKCGELIR